MTTSILPSRSAAFMLSAGEFIGACFKENADTKKRRGHHVMPAPGKGYADAVFYCAPETMSAA